MNSKRQLKLFAERVKSVREARGLNRTTLADAIGAYPQRIPTWESGRSFPELTTFFTLCQALGVCPYYLSGNSDVQHPWNPPTNEERIKYDIDLHCEAYNAHRDAVLRLYGRSMPEFYAAAHTRNTKAGDG